MLPDIDGFEVARRIRADGIATPVLFLTARDALDDKIAGFSVGGDDYVTKPFSLAEIVVRVRAILLRTTSTDEATGNQLVFADLVLDPDTREVSRAGTPIELTATEFNLLHFFIMNPRRVLSKPQILDHVWHYDFDGDSNILETYISYLRKKINRLGNPLIHTVRLVGYVLRDDESDGIGVAARSPCRDRRSSSRSSRSASPDSPRTPRSRHRRSVRSTTRLQRAHEPIEELVAVDPADLEFADRTGRARHIRRAARP